MAFEETGERDDECRQSESPVAAPRGKQLMPDRFSGPGGDTIDLAAMRLRERSEVNLQCPSRNLATAECCSRACSSWSERSAPYRCPHSGLRLRGRDAPFDGVLEARWQPSAWVHVAHYLQQELPPTPPPRPSPRASRLTNGTKTITRLQFDT